MTFTCAPNVNKTVCVVFNRNKRDKIIIVDFHCFKIGSSSLEFVAKFKFLGHFITSDQSDNADNQTFIMKCDKRTQNIESSVRITVQKNIKKNT